MERLALDTERALAALRGLPASQREAVAIRTITYFFEATWELADKKTLLTAAAEEQRDLEELVGAESFSRLCEEVARDRIRRAFPQFELWRVLEDIRQQQET